MLCLVLLSVVVRQLHKLTGLPAGVCAEHSGISLKYTKRKHTAAAAVRFYSPNKRSGWCGDHGHRPAILALNLPCHMRRRIYSDLYQLLNKLSSSRWSADSISEYVSLITMWFSKSGWTCYPHCLILLPGDDLHLSWGVLSVTLLLLFVGIWKACKHNVSPQCVTSAAILKLFAKRCPGGTHILFIYLHVHTHTHTHTHTYTHYVTHSPQLCHWSYKYGKALNVCLPLPAVSQISGPRAQGPHSRGPGPSSHSSRLSQLLYPGRSDLLLD